MAQHIRVLFPRPSSECHVHGQFQGLVRPLQSQWTSAKTVLCPPRKALAWYSSSQLGKVCGRELLSSLLSVRLGLGTLAGIALMQRCFRVTQKAFKLLTCIKQLILHGSYSEQGSCLFWDQPCLSGRKPFFEFLITFCSI